MFAGIGRRGGSIVPDEAYGSTLSRVSSSGLLAFLLTLTSPPAPTAAAFGVKIAERDDNKTAMVWVIVPGFIEKGEPWKACRNDVLLRKNRTARRSRV
jgi:hypothetical protein